MSTPVRSALSVTLRLRHLLLLPSLLSAALAAMALLPSIFARAQLRTSLWGAAFFLVSWTALSAYRSVQSELCSLKVVLLKQHYIQACAQATVMLYWGWYWREVYQALPLLIAQVVFAYGVDVLLSLWRRSEYTLGFGPLPIVFSINLFLWFKADWFWLQFLMIAVGMGAKEFIRWQKDGRRVHVFNPSSFPLAVFSLALIFTGANDLTWGQEIADTLNYAPHIYLVIFLVGLPGQLLFGVTTMTMAAVITMYVFGLAYYAATGTFFFVDSYIPIAVFLGMHLLFTDPSTSPSSEFGRIIFGLFYGLSVIVLYHVLARLGMPTFYDKLLPVPLLNVLIRIIDRTVAFDWLRRLDPARVLPILIGRPRYVGYVVIWTLAFTTLTAAGAVGDSHPGHWVPFWQRACGDGRENGCRILAALLSSQCAQGSGWSCNEFGILLEPALRPQQARRMFEQACQVGFAPGCANAEAGGSRPSVGGPPSISDYVIILREGKPLPSLKPAEVYRRACLQGFPDGCVRACELGDARTCGAHAMGTELDMSRTPILLLPSLIMS